MKQAMPYIDDPVPGHHVEVRFRTRQRNEAGDEIVLTVLGVTTREVEERVATAHPDWIPWGATLAIADRREAGR